MALEPQVWEPLILISSFTVSSDCFIWFNCPSSAFYLILFILGGGSLTLAEDLMPLIIARDTMAHAASKQPVMMGLNSPDSSIEFVMLRAFRNQKYDVGELLEHSFTVDGRHKALSESVRHKCNILLCFSVSCHASTCVIDGYISWTVVPRERILERIAQVEETPCNDDIIV